MLTSKQRSHLASLANRLEPSAALGKDGLSDAVAAHLDRELELHELVKLRFVDFKGEREELSAELAERCGAELVRLIGNTALIFRRRKEPSERLIRLPGDADADFPPKARPEPTVARKPAAKKDPGGTKGGPAARARAAKKAGPRKIFAGPRKPKRER